MEKGLELGLLEGERQSGERVEILHFQHMPHEAYEMVNEALEIELFLGLPKVLSSSVNMVKF